MDPEERKRGYSGGMTGPVLTGVRTSEVQRSLPLSGLSVLRHGAGSAVGMRGSAAGSGGHWPPLVPWRRPDFNTEDTENARSFTKEGNTALRAKRLKSPDRANGAPG